jgi:hypothetical protein
MRIGFIGAGIVAETISKHVLAVGHRVLLNSRTSHVRRRSLPQLLPWDYFASPVSLNASLAGKQNSLAEHLRTSWPTRRGLADSRAAN